MKDPEVRFVKHFRILKNGYNFRFQGVTSQKRPLYGLKLSYEAKTFLCIT